MINNMLIKAISKSQHTQRNWDLSKTIPEEDMKVLETCVTECPSKQNVPFYKPIFITNRDLIEKIHTHTVGFKKPGTNFSQTNSQTLANLLVVFVSDYKYIEEVVNASPEEQDYYDYADSLKQIREKRAESGALKDNRNLAIGIAAGYLNIVGTLLGMETGCCSCMSRTDIRELLKEHMDDVEIDDGKGGTIKFKSEVMLLMGLGYKDKERNRREHHLDSSYIFPTMKKVIDDVVHIN